MSLFRPKSDSADNHPFSNTGGPFNESSAPPQQPAPSSLAHPAVTTPSVPGPIGPADSTRTAAPLQSSLAPSETQAEGTPYRASGKSAPGGVARLLLATLVAGILVGVLYHLIARVFDFVIIFPLVAGVIAGSFVSSAVDKGRVRKPRLTVACALCASLLVYGTKQFLDSRQYRTKAIATAVESKKDFEWSKDLPPAQVEAVLKSEMDVWTTCKQFAEAHYKSGFNLRHNGIGEGIVIKGPWYIALVIAEIGCCALGAGVFAPSKAEDPYCEQTGRWLAGETILRVHPAQNSALLEKLNSRDWRGLLETPRGGPVDDRTNTELILYSAPGAPTATLMVKSITKGARPLAHFFIAPHTAESLHAICREIDERETAEQRAAAAGVPAVGTEL